MKELIDILDENGIKTGNVLSRKEVHQGGLWHRAIVVAIINDNNEILLQQRSANKEKNANMWDISVAGHVSAGQDSLLTAFRETSEEIGIDFDIKDFRYIFSFRSEQEIREDFIERQFYDFFILKSNVDIDDIKIQESEVQDIKFCSIDELKELINTNNIVKRQPVYEELQNYILNV